MGPIIVLVSVFTAYFIFVLALAVHYIYNGYTLNKGIKLYQQNWDLDDIDFVKQNWKLDGVRSFKHNTKDLRIIEKQYGQYIVIKYGKPINKSFEYLLDAVMYTEELSLIELKLFGIKAR